MQLDLLAQPTFRADAVAVADDEHPDHQLGIDRRTADVVVMRLELLMQVGEHRCHEHVHAAQQVVLRDAIFEPELVEQRALIPPLAPHHRPVLRCRSSISHRNHGSRPLSSPPFSTASTHIYRVGLADAGSYATCDRTTPSFFVSSLSLEEDGFETRDTG